MDLRSNLGNARNLAARINYGVQQGLRVSQFLSQAVIGSIALGRRPNAEQKRKLPPLPAILGDLKQLFEIDYANVEAGIYKAPVDDLLSPLTFSLNTFRFFKDLAKVGRRQARQDVQEAASVKGAEDLPKYFAQNFHFQTDGYLSEESADLYDHQVETVFGGGADAMRRQALVPLYRHTQKLGTQKIELLDVACGTGRFLREVKRNFPDVRATGLDLSPWYLKKAREVLQTETHVNFIEANAETIPFKNNHFDVVTNIFLFHELPRRVREIVAKEMVRVLKPGGRLIFVDSIQTGDKPQFDASLEHFPVNYHEPYYLDYIRNDLNALFGELGLTNAQTDLAFFSKVMSFTKLTPSGVAAEAEKPGKSPRSKAPKKARASRSRQS